MSETKGNPSTMDSPQIAYTDHDLLIRIESKLEHMTGDFASFKESTGREIGDHEYRLRSLERKLWTITGFALAAEVAIGLALHYWK